MPGAARKKNESRGGSKKKKKKWNVEWLECLTKKVIICIIICKNDSFSEEISEIKKVEFILGEKKNTTWKKVEIIKYKWY